MLFSEYVEAKKDELVDVARSGFSGMGRGMVFVMTNPQGGKPLLEYVALTDSRLTTEFKDAVERAKTYEPTCQMVVVFTDRGRVYDEMTVSWTEYELAPGEGLN